MNTTQPSGVFLPWLLLAVYVSVSSFQNPALRFLLLVAQYLQRAESWALPFFGASPSRNYRVFPPDDCACDDMQLDALFSFTLIILGHIYHYLGPRPPIPAHVLNTYPRLVRAYFRGHRVVEYMFSYLRIPLSLALVHGALRDFEADGDFRTLLLRTAMGAFLVAI
ncbi:hypothetical protein F5Y18DRAFT_433752 [Xylariaceae sp. FL1019]|nr:hypothetical protein F5Y18DRAFT_433752 [Xylariaceae sp. FL1019]